MIIISLTRAAKKIYFFCNFDVFEWDEVSFRQIPTNLRTIVRNIESIELKLTNVNLDKVFNSLCLKT